MSNITSHIAFIRSFLPLNKTVSSHVMISWARASLSARRFIICIRRLSFFAWICSSRNWFISRLELWGRCNRVRRRNPVYWMDNSEFIEVPCHSTLVYTSNSKWYFLLHFIYYIFFLISKQFYNKTIPKAFDWSPSRSLAVDFKAVFSRIFLEKKQSKSHNLSQKKVPSTCT